MCVCVCVRYKVYIDQASHDDIGRAMVNVPQAVQRPSIHEKKKKKLKTKQKM